MTLNDILLIKGRTVHTIQAGATLDDVAQTMVRNNCGSLLVIDRDGTADQNATLPTRGHAAGARIVGIITERDILRACAARRPLEQVPLAQVMSRELLTCTPSDSVQETMGLMTERRIRHLPVLDGDELAGMISIGDVVKAQLRDTAVENHYLKSYIQS